MFVALFGNGGLVVGWVVQVAVVIIAIILITLHFMRLREISDYLYRLVTMEEQKHKINQVLEKVAQEKSFSMPSQGEKPAATQSKPFTTEIRDLMLGDIIEFPDGSQANVMDFQLHGILIMKAGKKELLEPSNPGDSKRQWVFPVRKV